jgi:transposase-like protein
MTHKTVPDVPDGMQKIYQRFERWRSSHQGRLPIPKALWASAAEVAREHGVFRTATILRLEYAKLKRMTKSAAPVKRRAASPAEFLELVAPQVAPSGSGLTECVIELEGPRGKMRVQWKGTAAPDLAGLSRGLWESA